MKPNDSPCLNCSERKAHCHSDCNKYEAYRLNIDRLADIKQVEHKNDLYFIEKAIKMKYKYGVA